MSKMSSVLQIYKRLNLDYFILYRNQNHLNRLGYEFSEQQKLVDLKYDYNVRLGNHYKKKDKEDDNPL